MLPFLRARPTQTPPLLREMSWDGRALDLRLDPALAGERVAIDLDDCFFADAPVGADGRARFAFAFAPKAVEHACVMPRRGRDGSALAPEPSTIHFGRTGVELGGSASHVLDDGGSIGAIVPFGTDCAALEIAVIVPVYNAASLVERCLDSVIAHTTGRTRLIVIDDASPDTAIAPLLARYASRAGISILRNDRNLGFTATANRGIAVAGRADVVLLNADTEVGPNWLTGLRRAAACAANVATVTAVSDNAGAFSVPELERENAMPSAWTFEETARALWHDAGTAYPELPTGNGFCMYVRRAAFDAVGTFDEVAFPQGYGEENDFCQRASAHGYRHLIAGNVYVRHARSASFGHERRAKLGEAGMAVLRERWPNYERDVGATLFSFERRVLDWRVRRIFGSASAGAPRVRVASFTQHARRADKNVSMIELEEPRAAATSEREIAAWLQSSAIEVVLGDDAVPSSTQRLVASLGIPYLGMSPGADVETAVHTALASSRSFAR